MSAALRVDGERLWESLMTMAQHGATSAGGVSRLALSDEDRLCRDLSCSGRERSAAAFVSTPWVTSSRAAKALTPPWRLC